MPDLILVDGYNVIHSVDPYRHLKDADMEEAVTQLVRDLTNLAGSVDADLIVVFDGRGGGSSKQMGSGLTVVYSAEGQTADTVIERLVFERAAQGRVTVFTRDYAQRAAVWRPGVRCASPAALMDLMAEAVEEREPGPTGDKGLRVEDRLPEDIRRSLDRLRKKQ